MIRTDHDPSELLLPLSTLVRIMLYIICPPFSMFALYSAGCRARRVAQGLWLTLSHSVAIYSVFMDQRIRESIPFLVVSCDLCITRPRPAYSP